MTTDTRAALEAIDAFLAHADKAPRRLVSAVGGQTVDAMQRAELVSVSAWEIERLREARHALAAPVVDDPERARDIIQEAYETSGGPSEDLKNTYRAYVENERRKAPAGAALAAPVVTDEMVIRALIADRLFYTDLTTCDPPVWPDDWDGLDLDFVMAGMRAALTAALTPEARDE